MNYSVQDIITAVRVCLDEDSQNLIIDDGALSLDTIITQKIPDGVRTITEAAPSSMVDGYKSFASQLVWESGQTGVGMAYTELPSDFMRLAIFQMSDWKRPVLEPIEDTDSKYFLQKSKFPGIRGNVDKPVCAITTSSTGKRMEFYSSVEGSTVIVKVARYVSYPKIVDNSIFIGDKLYTPSIYYIAGLVLNTFKDAHSDRLFQIAKSYING